MTSFRLFSHSVRDNLKVVEVYEDSMLVAVIYPDERGIVLVSKYLPGHRLEMQARIEFGPTEPRKLRVKIWDGIPAGPVASAPGVNVLDTRMEPLPGLRIAHHYCYSCGAYLQGCATEHKPGCEIKTIIDEVMG